MQTQHDVHMWAGDLRESKQREGLWLLSQEDGWQASQSKQLWLCQQAGLGPVRGLAAGCDLNKDVVREFTSNPREGQMG